MHVAAIMVLLYRLRLVLLLTVAGSILYACGVWDMLNEVSVRENNGISWPASSVSLLTKYTTVNRRSASAQYVNLGEGVGRNSSKSTIVSSALSFYRNVPDGNAQNPSSAGLANVAEAISSNRSSFYYSTTFYYIETHKNVRNSRRQRARTRKQRRRMAIVPQQQPNGPVLLPLPVDSFTDGDNESDSSFASSLRVSPKMPRSGVAATANDALIYDQKTKHLPTSDDSGDDSNNFSDERRRAFMVVYQVSSRGSNHSEAQVPNHDKLLQIIEAADADNNEEYEIGESSAGYSPTATPSPLPPNTMSLQATPLPDITSSYFTSTVAGATNPTIREPHNYGRNSFGSSTTRRTYYQPIANNNTRRVDSDGEDAEEFDSAADDADLSSANDSSWWQRPLKLTSALNISDFPFMQYVISPQCPLPLYNVPANGRNAAFLLEEASPVEVSPTVSDGVYADANSSVVWHPNCAEAFAGEYAGCNHTNTGSRRVLIVVKSAQAHFERRVTIRNTWASHPQLIVRFLVGRAPLVPVISAAAEEEFEPFGSGNDTDNDGSSFTSWIHQAFATFLSNDTNSSSANAVDTSTVARAGRRAQRSAPETSDISTRAKSNVEKPSFDCLTPVECNVTRESRQFNDIILADFVDNYYNNTLKTLSGIHWAVQNCRLGSVEYVLLSDDDMWLNPYNLLEYLENATRNGTISADRDLYMGDLFPNSKPMRIRWSKW